MRVLINIGMMWSGKLNIYYSYFRDRSFGLIFGWTDSFVSSECIVCRDSMYYLYPSWDKTI